MESYFSLWRIKWGSQMNWAHSNSGVVFPGPDIRTLRREKPFWLTSLFFFESLQKKPLPERLISLSSERSISHLLFQTNYLSIHVIIIFIAMASNRWLGGNLFSENELKTRGGENKQKGWLDKSGPRCKSWPLDDPVDGDLLGPLFSPHSPVST